MDTTKVRFPELVDCVIFHNFKTATQYVSEKFTARATFRGKRDNRFRHLEVLLSLGSPNYAQRKRIKELKRAKEPFPVKRIELKPDAKKGN